MSLPNILDSVFGRIAPKRFEDDGDVPPPIGAEVPVNDLAVDARPANPTAPPPASVYSGVMPQQSTGMGYEMKSIPQSEPYGLSMESIPRMEVAPRYTQPVPVSDTAGPGYGRNAPEPTPDTSREAQEDYDAARSPISTIAPKAGHPEEDLYQKRDRLNKDGAKQDPFWKRMLLTGLRGAAFGPGGVLMGLGLGAFARGRYKKNKTNEELADVNHKIGALEEQRKLDDEHAKRGVEYTGVQLDNAKKLTDLQYDQLVKDPRWEVAKNKKQLTKEDAEYFNAKLKTNLSPASWQEFVEKVDPATGASKIRPVNDPRYSTNPTISPDATVPPVKVNVNGIEGSAKFPQVLSAVTAEATANANRAQGVATTNANNQFSAAKENAGAWNSYYSTQFKNRADVLKAGGSLIENKGEVEGAEKEVSLANNRVQRAKLTIDGLVKPDGSAKDPELYQKAVKEFNDAQQDFSKAQSKFDSSLGKTQAGLQMLEQLQGMDAQMEKPKLVSAPTIDAVQTQTIQPGGKVMTKATIKKAAKDHGTTYAEAARQAKQQGYTIQ